MYAFNMHANNAVTAGQAQSFCNQFQHQVARRIAEPLFGSGEAVKVEQIQIGCGVLGNLLRVCRFQDFKKSRLGWHA